MSVKKYSSYDVVHKLIGRVHAFGDTMTDEVRYERLKEQCYLISDLLDDVMDELKNKERPEWSLKRSGEYAYDFLTELVDDLKNVLED